MSDRSERIKQALAASRERLNTAFDAVGERWDEQIYSEGAAWTVRQLATHLTIADGGHNHMAMSIAAGQDIIHAEYDVQRYNKRSVEKYGTQSVADLRDALGESRAELIVWLDEIDDDALDQEGRYATLEILTVEEILLRHARHESGHAADILSFATGNDA